VEVILIEILASLEIHRVSAVVGILHGGELVFELVVEVTCLFTGKPHVVVAPGAGLHFCNAKSAPDRRLWRSQSNHSAGTL